ncbi:MAG: hypothetical protein AB1652_09740 [Bacillota bacterium]
MLKANDEVFRNLRRPEIREAPKRRWEWTRCRPLMIAMIAIVLLCYLKWAGFVRW